MALSVSSSGYFTQISTLADVQENVMEYLHVLSRPKVIDREHDTVWTEAYIDSTVSGLRTPVPPVLANVSLSRSDVSNVMFGVNSIICLHESIVNSVRH